MNSQTLQMLAHRYMHAASSEVVIQWAVDMLYEGFDTESLMILAGLTPIFSREEIERYLRKSLAELGWDYPEEEPCLRQYAHAVASAISTGSLKPTEGCHEMYYITLALNYPKDLRAWFDIDDGLDPERYDDIAGKDFDDTVIKYARKYLSSGTTNE